MGSHTYLALALAFYTVGALHVFLHALTRRQLLTSWTVVTTLGGFILHTASLSQRWTEAGHFPAVGLHDTASFLAWAIVLAFLATYVRTRIEVLGLAIYPVVFGLVLLANLAPEGDAPDAVVKSLFLPVHVTLAFFGYAALFLAFAMSLLYLIQERELKSRSPRAFYYLVPSLERCDTISAGSASIGFVFLTLAIITGMLWSHAARGRYWAWDAKETSALVAWIIYVGLIVTRYRTGWGGRRAAYAGIAGFAAVVFTFVSITLGTGGGRTVLVVVGVSHRTAPVEIREALAFGKDALPETLRRLRQDAPMDEVMILSTCNRVEVYAHAADAEGAERLALFLAASHGRTPQDLDAYVYRLSGDEAVRHAFRVAASLDSMVIGEPQILGQVKEAYHIADGAGTLGSTLQALRNRSLASAKRARSETGIGHNAVSVSYVAVELARKIFGDLRDRNVLLVGAGKMSELAAKHLVRNGARATVLGGRTFARAEQLAASLGGRARPFESLREELGRADIAISGTGAPGFVIHREDVAAACAARHRRPLFLIDIAVPRDVDPSVRNLEGVFLYDVDDLRSVAEANLRERRKQAAAAEALVEREAREFLDWQRSLDIVPLLVELRRRGEDVRAAEIAKVRARLGTLSPEQEEALQAATTAIVNKLLHPPTVQLKEVSRNGHAAEHLGLIRKLLGL